MNKYDKMRSVRFTHENQIALVLTSVLVFLPLYNKS